MSNSSTKHATIKPADLFPDLIRKLVRIKVLTDELQEELTQEALGSSIGVTRQAIDSQITKYKKQREAKV
jgi:hypothetical protein